MDCLIALIIFLALLLFSYRHRRLTHEAIDCVLRQLKGDHGKKKVDKRLKSKSAPRVFGVTQKTGKKLYTHFRLFSWVFIILLLASSFLVIKGIVFYFAYGSCSFQQEKVCPYDTDICGKKHTQQLQAPTHIDIPSIGYESYENHIIEFGCYTCPKSKESFTYVRELIQTYPGKIYYTYVDHPLSSYPFSDYTGRMAQCISRINDKAYWPFHGEVMDYIGEVNEAYLYSLAMRFGIEEELLRTCVESGVGKDILQEHIALGEESGIYGTPTFFVNGQALVAPSNIQELEALLK